MGICHTYVLVLIMCYVQNLHVTWAWNTDEMEVFDAVEEVKQNFYTLLDVPQNAVFSEIKRSYRKLSLITHPDHNQSPTADEEFRHLVLAFDTLKSTEKRLYYDNILINGLPDWKNALYYYRRVRKMGLQEMFIILAAIISVGQYLVAWAAYLEQKFTVKELLKSKDRKLMRRMKKNKNESLYSDEYIESAISKPSVRNTLPFQICYLVKGLTLWMIRMCIKKVKECWKREPKVPEPVRPREPQPKPERPKRVDFVPELVKTPTTPKYKPAPSAPTSVESPPVISGGLWTDDDILELIRLVKKHPAGEAQRWVKIASGMARSVAEVTHMANKIKDNDFRPPTESEEATVVVEEPKKVKTKGGKLGTKLSEVVDEADKVSTWTQTQQKAFEVAINKYSKKANIDRWEKIASSVPGKTKEDCILRYRKITNMIKQRKEEEEGNQEAEPPSTENKQSEETEQDTASVHSSESEDHS